MQDLVLCVKMGEGLVGEAATRGEGICTQHTTGRQIMPAFESVLGIQDARSCLIQPIRCSPPIAQSARLGVSYLFRLLEKDSMRLNANR